MRNLWREAGIAALVCGSLTACASPAYPISDDRTADSARLTMARPAYPISDPAPPRTPAPAVQPPAAAPDDAEPSLSPLAAPVSPVESQPLPPPESSPPPQSSPTPGPSASNLDTMFSGGARLQLASLSTQATPSSAGAATSTPPTATPVSTSLPPATANTTTPAPSTASPPTPTPAPTTPAPAAAPAPAPAAEPALTPQMVVHDQPAPPPVGRQPSPPVREAAATAPDRLLNASPAAGVPGGVIDAPGGIFENYEVQRGDHIDALARAFSTTRDLLIDANHIRAPFTIHPGEIIKVPVAKAYVARSGETLVDVARRFSVGVDELAQLNHVSARAPLRPGQQIGLPSSMRDRGAEYADNGPAPSSYAPPTSSYVTPERPYRSYPPSSTVHVPSAETPPRYLPPSSPTTETQAATMSDNDIAQAAHGRFVWPVRGDMMARFGPQGVGRRNDGIDIRASQGTVVKAAASGEVVYAGNQVPGFGNLVLIKHADGWVTAYAHLDQVEVQMKQQVAQGQPLGSVGTSGGATEPELHFEVRFAPTPADKARPVDPVLVLPLG